MKLFKLIATGTACIVTAACGPSIDDITAACVEMSETRKMDGARRIRILRELGVPADELQLTHLVIESDFKRGGGVIGCVDYLAGSTPPDLAFSQGPGKDAEEPESIGILIASVDIEPNTPIRSTDAKYIILPRNVVPTGAYTRFEDLKDTISKKPILRGELLLGGKDMSVGNVERSLTESSTAGDVAPTPSASGVGFRATTVRVRELSGRGKLLLPKEAVKPGGYISLIDIEQESGSIAEGFNASSSRMRILAVDQEPTSPPSDLVAVNAVTLDMPPSDAERLASIRKNRPIEFSLR